ncbi:hypothetical protein SteCoe_37085 [Stentor coeruleus]|uniref:Uncharacterized protein n=1 Tax=Stentor coeruleus TaxID=5963 RepID=A0A1R2ANR1_9CILI|nr:hypothetical protein SteCoe_37085 [Stentor coeruleus]
MEGSLLKGHREKSLKTPRNTLAAKKKSLFTHIDTYEMPASIAAPGEILQSANEGMDIKIVISRAPKNSALFLHNMLKKSSFRPDSGKKPILKIVDKADLENFYNLRFAKPEPIFMPEKNVPRKSNHKRLYSDSLTSGYTKSFDIQGDPWSNLHKPLDVKQPPYMLYKLSAGRKAPARYLPAIEMKTLKNTNLKNLHRKSLNEDMRILIENNYDQLNSEILIEKKHKDKKIELQVPTMKKRLDGEKWGWSTPMYTEVEGDTEDS